MFATATVLYQIVYLTKVRAIYFPYTKCIQHYIMANKHFSLSIASYRVAHNFIPTANGYGYCLCGYIREISRYCHIYTYKHAKTVHKSIQQIKPNRSVLQKQFLTIKIRVILKVWCTAASDKNRYKLSAKSYREG